MACVQADRRVVTKGEKGREMESAADPDCLLKRWVSGENGGIRSKSVNSRFSKFGFLVRDRVSGHTGRIYRRIYSLERYCEEAVSKLKVIR